MNELLPKASLQRPGQVQSVARALTVLDLLGSPENSAGLGLTEIAHELGVSKSTVHALLQTLKQYGYVTRVLPGPRFLLGMSLMRLGERVHRTMPLTDAAQPFLQSLASITGCTARLVVPEHGYPLYVSRVEGIGNIQFNAQIGKRERPHTTGVGKVILSSMNDSEALAFIHEHGLEKATEHTITDVDDFVEELKRIRAQGFAIDREEDSDGIVCIASGIVDPSGICIGAISVSDLAIRMTPDRIDTVSRTVKDHAERLSESLS